MEIVLPFKAQFKEAMLSGEKTKTSRTKQYGTIGDTFKAFGSTFIIIDQCEEPLETVAKEYYKEEGFEQQEQFINIWIEIHPRKGWDPMQKVWVHEFRRIADAGGKK